MNNLITLRAYDSFDGCIHHETARIACGIRCGNRWDGYFTTTSDGHFICGSASGRSLLFSSATPPRYVQIPNCSSLFYLNLKECPRHRSVLGVSSCALLCSLDFPPRQPTRAVGATISIIAFELWTTGLANPIRCHPRRNDKRRFLSN